MRSQRNKRRMAFSLTCSKCLKKRTQCTSPFIGKIFLITEKTFIFDGVLEWFQRISAYGKEQGVSIEHYIISSGIREMILFGTPIAKEFKKIYASSFMYDHNGVAHWPCPLRSITQPRHNNSLGSIRGVWTPTIIV